jgi:hypothetical protein
VLAVLAMVVIGLIIGGDFGVSIDEPRHEQYGRETLEIYSGQRGIDQTSVDPREHGPFYSFLAYTAGSAVAQVRPGWYLADGIHFVDYLSFVLATGLLWLLCRRYSGPASASIIAVAFFTQPLLFGHAFINPKDIPFMAFTLAGLTLGLWAIPQPRLIPETTTQDRSRWSVDRRWRRSLVAASVVGLCLSVALLLWKGWLPLAQGTLAAAYGGDAPALLNTAFRLLARNAASAPLEAYQAKLATWLDLARLGAAAGLIFCVILAWAAALRRPDHSRVESRWSFGLAAASGLVLGLATAIRAVAPIIALPLIVLYIIEFRRRSIAYIALMVTVAAAATIAAWPYLWHDTVRRYLESLAVLSHFPWTGDILFNGQLLDQGQQPWFYIPELIGVQITLPVLALAAGGLGVLSFCKRRHQTRLEIVAICATLAVPVIASLRPGTIVYNNFRQFLFTMPALFLLAGLGLDELFRRLSRTTLRVAAAALIVAPGIAGLIRLHPYEYIYYNALAGTGPSVYERFESDYWCTSYREAIRWVNANAPDGAIIAMGSAGFTEQVAPFARPDLTVVRLGSELGTTRAALAIVCDGLSGTLHLLPDAPVLTTIGGNGVVLAEVKAINAGR